MSRQKKADPYAPNYGPFQDLDGRTMISPPAKYSLHGRPSAKVRVSSARRLIDELNRYGMTNHSQMCSMLWVSIWWCEFHKRDYVVKFYGVGGAVLFLDNIQPGVHV